MTPTQRRTMLATRLSILLPPREVEQPAEDGKPARLVAVDWTPADVSSLLRLEGASEAKLSGLERMATEAEALGGRERWPLRSRLPAGPTSRASRSLGS